MLIYVAVLQLVKIFAGFPEDKSTFVRKIKVLNCTVQKYASRMIGHRLISEYCPWIGFIEYIVSSPFRLT